MAGGSRMRNSCLSIMRACQTGAGELEMHRRVRRGAEVRVKEARQSAICSAGRRGTGGLGAHWAWIEAARRPTRPNNSVGKQKSAQSRCSRSIFDLEVHGV